jgi:hypothetical protein
MHEDIFNKHAVQAYWSHVSLARRDPATFCGMVLRDERTGAEIEMQEFHFEWHDLLNKHRFVVLFTCPELGKTQQLAVGRILWFLGKDPRRRYAVLSATQNAAKKVISVCKSLIENSDVIHDIFPELKRGELWTDTAFEVQRPPGIKDPSMQAYAADGGSIQGARLDGLVIDDVLTADNTRTAYYRDKIDTWVKTSALSRLSGEAWVAFLTNVWHRDDAAHRAEKLGWTSRRYAVRTPEGKSIWPKRWSEERIEEFRAEVLGPPEFSRVMMLRSRDDAEKRFKQEWFDLGLAQGEGLTVVNSFDDLCERFPDLAESLQINETIRRLGGLPENLMIISGVDIAVGKRSNSGLSSIFSLLSKPDFSRQLLSIEAGRWSGPEIISRIISVHDRFRSTLFVENNAAQDFIIQWALERDSHPELQNRVRGLRIHAFTTGSNKLNPFYGVESLAAELAGGRWVIPCERGTRRTDNQVAEWMTEVLDYSPEEHTGDRMMSGWFAMEACRAYERRRRRSTDPTRQRLEGGRAVVLG